MRHVLLVAVAALAIAIVLVLVLGEEEAGEDTTPVTVTQPGPEHARTETAPATEPPAGGDGSRDAKQVEEAVFRYVEAAEAGEVRAPGLPTTDELSIRNVAVEGDRATVRLAGGERLSLRKRGGRWRVTGLSVG